MKNLTNYIKKHSTRLTEEAAVVAVLVASVVVTGASVMAYGPSRPTFTIEKPADHITFNSITNNPNYGDERGFTLIKDAANTSAGGWSDEINVEDGKEYLVRVYVHNNAAENLNLVAQNTRISANVPTTTGTSVQIAANVIADNASPQRIWDEVVMKSDKKFNVAYVNGSARYYNNKFPANGLQMSDSIVTSAGALVGYEALDGKVPGCFQYSGIATFKVKVQAEKVPNFTVDKKVRLQGTTEWQDNITAKAGQKVEYRVGYDNISQVIQNKVIVKDLLPKGVSYDKGTTFLKNASNPTGDGMKYSDGVAESGINIGNYGANSNAFVKFTATLPTNDKLEICGTNKLINAAAVSTEYGQKQDTATVTVEKENCGPRECKAGVPEGDKRCEEAVTELPTTGPAELIGALTGITAVTLAAIYYTRSRNDVKKHLAAAGPAVQNDHNQSSISSHTNTNTDHKQ